MALLFMGRRWWLGTCDTWAYLMDWASLRYENMYQYEQNIAKTKTTYYTAKIWLLAYFIDIIYNSTYFIAYVAIFLFLLSHHFPH